MEDQNFKDKIQLIENANNKIFNNKNGLYKTNKDIVFVYTQPKVGSTTLVSSIRISASDKFTVIHVHDESTLKIVLGIENVTINEIIKYNSYLGHNVYVIDVYRTPIERKMSVFFEEISAFHFNHVEEIVNTYNVKKVIKRFNDIFPFLALKDNYIDVYDIANKEPFDFEKKYICQKIDNVTYIKLRLKDSNEWGKILSNLLGKEIIIVEDYKTTNKKISNLYQRFKNEYKVPRNFFEDIKSCKLLNYYYSEQERVSYVQDWSQKLTDEYTPFNDDLYNSYIKICLENQKYNFIQNEHYIDSGCLCKHCSNKRFQILIKAKNGLKINEKIIHSEMVNTYLQNMKQNRSGPNPNRQQGMNPNRQQGMNPNQKRSGPNPNKPTINQNRQQGINPNQKRPGPKSNRPRVPPNKLKSNIMNSIIQNNN